MNLTKPLVGAFLLSVLWACGADDGGPTDPDPTPEPEDPVATTLAVTPDTGTLTAVGDTLRLDAEVRDQNGDVMADAAVTWTSLDTAVATVSGSGAVVAVAAGAAHVVAESGQAADTAVITVSPEAVEVVLDPDTTTFTAIGDTARLTAEARDANGHAVEGASVVWTSLDTTVATVDDAGGVEAVGGGATRVVAASGGAADTAVVTVAQLAAGLALAQDTATINALGDTLRLGGYVHDANGHPIEGAALAWTSLDETVATVDSTGAVVSVATGTVDIVAAADAFADTATVRIRQVPATVTITVPDDTLAEGETVQLTAAVADSNGYAIPGAGVQWETSDTTAARVDSGRVTAVWGDAVVVITAASGPAWGYAAIVVLGKIAFTSTRDGDSEIYVMNSDGSGLTQLTSNTEIDDAPAWSPDGKNIAFHSYRSGSLEVWAMAADGTSPTNMTGTAGGSQPTWSPDGMQIAFTRNVGGGYAIVLLDEGGETVLETDTAFAGYTAWSPDGNWIAFYSTRAPGGDGDIWIVPANPADTTGPVQLTENDAEDTYPAFSPDGRKLAFASNQDGDYDIYVADFTDGSVARLTDDTYNNTAPSWSPDGSRIVFSSNRSGDYEIWIMGADGSHPVRLTHNTGRDTEPAWRGRPGS